MSGGKQDTAINRILPVLLALFLAAACLTGCSSGNSSSSSSPSPSSGSSSGSSSSGSSSGSSSSSPQPSDDAKTGNITVSGSTALQPLLTQAVEPFKSDREFTGAVTINGGGSLQGLTDVSAGTSDIGSSDLSPTQAGMDETGFVDHQVAIVAVGIAVSDDVAASLTDISVSDLKGIFTGAVTDWKQVAGWKGASLPIAVCCHQAGSGIRYVFETYGIAETLTDAQLTSFPNFTRIPSSANLQGILETGKGAIGYAALPYCSRLALLKVEGVEASYENVYSGAYKIWACEHLYTRGEPTAGVKAFLEYVTSSDFEETITKNGYGLISEMKVSR